MTTTGQQLVSNSTLVTGTAMLHLLNQMAGGSGLVVNDGISVVLDPSPVSINLRDDIAIVLEREPIAVTVADTIVASLAPAEIEIQEH